MERCIPRRTAAAAVCMFALIAVGCGARHQRWRGREMATQHSRRKRQQDHDHRDDRKRKARRRLAVFVASPFERLRTQFVRNFQVVARLFIDLGSPKSVPAQEELNRRFILVAGDGEV